MSNLIILICIISRTESICVTLTCKYNIPELGWFNLIGLACFKEVFQTSYLSTEIKNKLQENLYRLAKGELQGTTGKLQERYYRATATSHKPKAIQRNVVGNLPQFGRKFTAAW